MTEREVDVVVLGAGPAGEVAAGRLGEAGLDVVLVEPHLVGGECSFYACMPSKGLLRPPQALAEVRRIPGAAEAATGALDVQAVLDRRDEIVHDLSDDSQLPWIEKRGIALLRTAGRIEGERVVQAGAERLRARTAVIVATGSAAAIPPVPGLAEANPWTNREVTTAKRIPERLAILGAGVVGVEMAQAYAELGSTVTLIEPAPRVLAREEPFAAEQVTAGLQQAGVHVRCSTSAESVRRDGDGPVTLVLQGGDEIEADELLVAAGRRPNTTDIGVETLGFEPGKPLPVDDQLRVDGHPWLFAIGDVNGRVLLTHMGKHQARVATDVILGKGGRLRPLGDGQGSPRVMFTEPQVAAVGHTEESAREAGLDFRIVEAATSGNAGASFYGRGAPGTARLLIDEARRVIVGATFTGVDVQDFLHAATIAVVGEVPIDDLWFAVPSFPTRSEVWLYLLEELL